MLNKLDIRSLTTALVVFGPDARILLIHREPDKQYASLFGLPAGRVRLRENVISAAWRELVEETGIPQESAEFMGYVRSYSDAELMMVTWWGRTAKPNKIRTGEWYTYAQIKEINKQGKLAPNVLDAIEEAMTLREKASRMPELSDLYKVISKAQKSLVDSFYEIDERAGWNHYLNHKGVGIIGTSVGLLTLAMCGIRPNHPIIIKAGNWLKSMQESEGGWSTRSIRKVEAVSVTESTALALRAMSQILEPHDECVKRGIRWLELNQLADGSWGTNRFSPRGTTYATSIAISTLLETSEISACHRGVEWLRSSQNRDGGWGIYSDLNAPFTPAHTAHAVIALIRYGDSPQSNVIANGLDWLRRQYVDGAGWEDTIETQLVNSAQGRDVLRLELRHYSNPWAAMALLSTGDSPFSDQILSVLCNIAKLQESDGTWPHSLASGNKPIWAVHDAVMFVTEAYDRAKQRTFELSAQNIQLTGQLFKLANDISQLYGREFVRVWIIPRISIFGNVFLLTFLVVYIFRTQLLLLLSLPAIPWVWELTISILVTATLPWIYRFLRSTIGEVIVRMLKPTK